MVRWIVLSAAAMIACAPVSSARTIEPTSPAGDGSGGDGFVLSRAPSRSPGVAPGDIPIHLSASWFEVRAKHLGIDVETARARDAAMSTVAGPPAFWDAQTAIEAVSVWSALCNECHGGRRRESDALRMPPPPVGWGTGEGLFFGARRPYEDIFGVISLGGPPRNGVPSEMPAWRDKLAHEQIWSLIYFLEFQSGGIEGRFPPSLYPRGTGRE